MDIFTSKLHPFLILVPKLAQLYLICFDVYSLCKYMDQLNSIQMFLLWIQLELDSAVVMSLCKWGCGLLWDTSWGESVLLACRAGGEGRVPVLDNLCEQPVEATIYKIYKCMLCSVHLIKIKLRLEPPFKKSVFFFSFPWFNKECNHFQ